MNTKIGPHKFWTYFIAMAVWMIAANPLFAQRVCCQGDLWLKWSQAARTSYVWGYTEGFTKGQRDGCQSIQDSKDRIQTKCPKEEPDFSRGSDSLVSSVTEFYTRYPKDRDIYIDEILDLLGKGLSLDQIHSHPFWRHTTPAAKP